MDFATRLKDLRKEKSLTREELATKSGMSHGAVRDYEQGRRKPSLENAIRLADALGVSVAEFSEEPARGRTRKK